MLKVINVISDSNIAGAGNVLLSFLEHYDSKEIDMVIILPKKSLLIPEIEKLSVRYIEADGIAEKSFDIHAVFALYKIFSKEKPDIVHTHAVLSARIAARFFGCKIIHTRHSVFEPNKKQKSFPYKQIAGMVNNFFSDVIIAVSPAAKENLVLMGTKPSKIKVVYNGVKPVEALNEYKKKAVRARFGISETDFVCVIAARLEKVKGHEYILRAAKLLQEKSKDFIVLIAGSGSEESELKKLCAELNLTNCIFAGFVSDVSSVQNIMHLQLNASYGTEATSMALLEGMSLGIPAVVSDFGGNPYVIDDGVNGIVVPQKDYYAIYEAVVSLYENKKVYTEMQIDAIDIYNTKFTANVTVKAIQNIYFDTAEKKGIKND